MRSQDAQKLQGFVGTHSGELTTTGTCTALAMNASRELMEKYPGVYDFLLYDVGNHKLARCINTGVVVDSASRHGAYLVLPGQEWTRGKMVYKWDVYGSGTKTNTETGVVSLVMSDLQRR